MHASSLSFPPKLNTVLRKPFPPGLARSPQASLVNLKVHTHIHRALSASSSPLFGPHPLPFAVPKTLWFFSPFSFVLSPYTPAGIGTKATSGDPRRNKSTGELLSLMNIRHLGTLIDASLPSTHRVPLQPIYLAPMPCAGWTRG